MADRIPETLRKKISDRLSFYEDLGIGLFYQDRNASPRGVPVAVASSPGITAEEEPILPKTLHKQQTQKAVPGAAPALSPLAIGRPAASKIARLPVPAGPSLFEVVDKVADDTLLKIREDLGDCTRSRLHNGRNKLVFVDGNPNAELVFVG